MDLISLEQAFALLEDEAKLRLSPEIEVIPVNKAINRVLAKDQVSRIDIPPFDKSAMDGFALRLNDEHDAYRVVNTLAAGQYMSEPMQAGTAVKIMTGAPLPPGAGRVVMYENVTLTQDQMVIKKPSSDLNICRQGEDIRAGQKILKAGTIIDPLSIGNMISCGISHVEVFRPFRASIISTGNELVNDVSMLKPGKIMDTNGPLLSQLLIKDGFDLVMEVKLPDDYTATFEGIKKTIEKSDIIILTGGISVGEFDFIRKVLLDLGAKIHFSGVKIKPGRPMTLASCNKTLLFGLPGNPLAAWLTYHLFVLRAADHLLGSPYRFTEKFWLPLATRFSRKKTYRQEYRPVSITSKGMIQLLELHGSAHLSSLLKADGLAVFPAGPSHFLAGQEVGVIITHPS